MSQNKELVVKNTMEFVPKGRGYGLEERVDGFPIPFFVWAILNLATGILKICVEAGTQVNVRYTGGRNAIEFLLEHVRMEGVEEVHLVEMIEFLLEQGVSVEKPGLVATAIEKKFYSVLECLLRNGATVDETAFNAALNNIDVFPMQFLILNGAEVPESPPERLVVNSDWQQMLATLVLVTKSLEWAKLFEESVTDGVLKTVPKGCRADTEEWNETFRCLVKKSMELKLCVASNGFDAIYEAINQD
jgi:hypothetical protein